MRFAACLKKDMRLLTGGGWRQLLFLLLPVALVFLMLPGMKTAASADELIAGFKIAVRDEDETVMSRLLISQLDHVSLFSSAVRAGERSDEELGSEGCAAVVTIPKDFFYDLYDMHDTDLIIALNSDMPQQANIVKSVFTSLISILEENQKVYYAAARTRFGELSDEQMQEVYYDYSNSAIEDALSRLDYFELAGLYEKGFDTTKLFFSASLLSMILLFIPLTMLRSVSEEIDSGLLSRFTSAGGSITEMLVSKLFIAFIMTAIPAAAVLLILRPGHLELLIPVLLITFLLSFALFLFTGLISGRSAAAQLIGNLIMLVILTLGGAFYPVSLLPNAFSAVSRFMLPNIILSSLQSASLGRGLADISSTLTAAGAAALALFVLSLIVIRIRRRA